MSHHPNAGHNRNTQKQLWKYANVQVLGNNNDTSKWYSRSNRKMIREITAKNGIFEIFGPRAYQKARRLKYMKMRLNKHLASMEMWNAPHNVMTPKIQGHGILGRSRRRWDENIKTDLREIISILNSEFQRQASVLSTFQGFTPWS